LKLKQALQAMGSVRFPNPEQLTAAIRNMKGEYCSAGEVELNE
jgi:hypothetical protein